MDSRTRHAFGVDTKRGHSSLASSGRLSFEEYGKERILRWRNGRGGKGRKRIENDKVWPNDCAGETNLAK